jgi:hypothetical protein
MGAHLVFGHAAVFVREQFLGIGQVARVGGGFGLDIPEF